MHDLISRAELFNALAPVQTLEEAYAVIQKMPTKDISVPTMMKDGTLNMEIGASIDNVKRILLSQKGTTYGALFYSD